MKKVAVDAAGNTCVAGQMTDSLALGDSSYKVRGTENVFVARYDNAGQLLWSQRLGDSGKTVCTALAVDRATGDVYVAGTYQRVIRIGDSVYTGRVFHVAFLDDIFLVKYSASGKLCWAQTFGSWYGDELAGMDVDSRHNLVIGGSFVMAGASPPIIDSITFGTIQLVGRGNHDIFIAKCDSGGQFLWAKNPGGKTSEDCFDLCLGSRDNIVICGTFSNSLQLDGITVSKIDQGMFGGGTFIALLDSSGQAIWAKPVGGIGPSSGSSGEVMYASYCAADSAGNVYIGGNYTGGTLIFDATDRSTALPGGGQWLAKYAAADGKVLWTMCPGAGNGFMRGMCSDLEGNLYVTGGCSQGAVYGTDTVKTANSQSLLVLKYAPSGQQLWMQNAGDAAGATGFGIAAAIPDEPVVVGSFGGGPSINFGSTTCYNTSTQGNGFVAKLKPVAASVPGTQAAAVLVYPNPASHELHVEQAAGGYNRYALFNALGQRAASGLLRPEQRQTIQLPALAPGVYYLELAGDMEHFRRSVIIQP